MEYNLIESESWSILIPEGWIQKDSGREGQLLFGSKDGSVAFYIATFNAMSDSDEELQNVLNNLKSISKRNLDNMEGHRWEKHEIC